MNRTNGIGTIENKVKNINELEKLGYDIFSENVESMEITKNLADQEKFKYYTLYRYTKLIEQFGNKMVDIPPIDRVIIKTKFVGVPYTFEIPVDISFLGPDQFDKKLIDRIKEELKLKAYETFLQSMKNNKQRSGYLSIMEEKS